MIDKRILSAIRKKDCFSVLTRLLMDFDFPEDFSLIDDNSGKTLQQLIKESEIDFSIQQPVMDLLYNPPNFNITPIHYCFLNLPHYGVPDFRRLRLLLLLEADVNQEIDNEGNTILHESMYKKRIHRLALRELIKSGGNIYKKNIQGKTPLDLADPITSKYLLELNNEFSEKNKKAIIIQRYWRQKKNIETQSIKLTHPNLPLIAHKPLKSNPPNKEKAKRWIEIHKEADRTTAEEVIHSIKHITFEHFLFGLKMAIKKFNLYIHTLPKEKQSFAVLIDKENYKSGPWVTKLAQQFLTFQPNIIVDFEELWKFTLSTELSHIVYFDDASYTGNNLFKLQDQFYSRFLEKNPRYMNLRLHLVVPFISERARERFQKFPTLLHTQEIIPSFKVKGTFFKGETATYFAHKIPVYLSTIECIENGKLITGEESGISFVEPITPPYKLT